MVITEFIITGIATGIIGLIGGWKLNRVKVKNTELDNVDKAAEIWRKLADGLNKEMQLMRDENKELRKKIDELTCEINELRKSNTELKQEVEFLNKK